jgi:uncharacterized protein with PhoU and TrkA domain
MEVQVKEGDWLVGKDLKACYLNKEGVSVLGINRDDGSYVGVPRSSTEIYAGDTLILYGRSEQLQDLDKRRADIAGEKSHEQAVNKQNMYMAQQDEQESESRRKRRIRKENK